MALTVMSGQNGYKGMSISPNLQADPGQPVFYQVRVKGHLGDHWTDWFGSLAITLEDNGETLLSGPVVDQASLYGLLRKVRDMGMLLVSVNRVKPDQAAALEVEENS